MENQPQNLFHSAAEVQQNDHTTFLSRIYDYLAKHQTISLDVAIQLNRDLFHGSAAMCKRTLTRARTLRLIDFDVETQMYSNLKSEVFDIPYKNYYNLGNRVPRPKIAKKQSRNEISAQADQLAALLGNRIRASGQNRITSKKIFGICKKVMRIADNNVIRKYIKELVKRGTLVCLDAKRAGWYSLDGPQLQSVAKQPPVATSQSPLSIFKQTQKNGYEYMDSLVLLQNNAFAAYAKTGDNQMHEIAMSTMKQVGELRDFLPTLKQ